jgi:hypothetical protein
MAAQEGSNGLTNHANGGRHHGCIDGKTKTCVGLGCSRLSARVRNHRDIMRRSDLNTSFTANRARLSG